MRPELYVVCFPAGESGRTTGLDRAFLDWWWSADVAGGIDVPTKSRSSHPRLPKETTGRLEPKSSPTAAPHRKGMAAVEQMEGGEVGGEDAGEAGAQHQHNIRL
eukprot:scaffold139661_cov81-Phaeocystis_antarctica.AAC.1